MSREMIFECLMKIREHAEEMKNDDRLDVVEDAEKAAIEEVLGLTFVEGKPLNDYLLAISPTASHQS